VAHPALVSVAREIFDEHMKTPNQIDSKREPAVVGAEDLLAVPPGPITAEGLRWNINVGLLYLESWLRGSGCVPIYNLMEDAATAEICRSQVWQWVKHGAKLEGPKLESPLESGDAVVTPEATPEVTPEMALEVLAQQIAEETERAPDHAATMEAAGRLLRQMIVAEEFPEFLTLAAYEEID
jgi:malate synthase